MKKLLFLSLILAASTSPSFGVGTFGFGIELTGTGTGATNDGITTLYALDQNGGTRLEPTTPPAMFSTAWTSASNDSTPTFDLGTFNPAAGDTLLLNGGSILVYLGGGTIDPNAQYLNYGVNLLSSSSNSFAPGINLPIDSTDASGSGNGDERFASGTQDTNLLADLAPGTYVLETYGYASGAYDNNGGNNFAATFTVVPEPGTWAMLLVGGLGALVLVRCRRSLAS